ncbi:unnamed protein product [Rotaria sp. Silwood1]|nr:unnamed protein product [Rotaria sp. Silwood1]
MTSQGNKCPICLKLFNDPRWMPCKHIYCFKCIPKLHRRDLDTKDQIVFECRICAMGHGFNDWSTLKYYVTLHCVPYVTALQFDKTSSSSIKSSCSACFNVINRDLNVDHLEFCIHCNKKICRECLIDHRMELKKNILHVINEYRLLVRKNQQLIQETKDKLENMKMHIDFCAFDFIDQIDTYCESIFAQINEQKYYEETNSSSGYESLNEQPFSDLDHDLNQQSILHKNVILTVPSVMPIHLLGELILPDTNLLTSLVKSSTSRLLWSVTCVCHPSHIVFESESSKLFICTEYGYVSVYSYTTLNLSLIDTFYLQYNEKPQPVIIKSLTVCVFSLIVIFNSSVESILDFYSHNGLLLHSVTLFNEYISQIRFDHNYLWCLELISSTIFYFLLQSNDIINKNLPEKTQFISFKQQSFNPYRFDSNQTFVAVMDRASTGIILLFDRYTASYLKQIKTPLTDLQPYDIELTNQMLIYRFPHIILLTQLDNEQSIEFIKANRNLSITKGKSDTEFLVTIFTLIMPLFTRDFVSCHVKPSESHLYNDPVMLICSHAFCRSCCLELAKMSNNKSIMCPICSTRIPFDNLDRFANSLISHGTLATMVKQYLREEKSHHICDSCQKNYISDDNGKLCKKCEIDNGNIKRKIIKTIENCEYLIENQKSISLEKIHEQANQLHEIIDQQTRSFFTQIDKYQEELENLLTTQQKANDINALKHQPIDINTVSRLVEPRLNTLRNSENILENINVEKEIKRLTDVADRQLRLLKHKADIVPMLSSPTENSLDNIFGELLYKSIESESKTSNSSSDQSMINTYGDTSLQSIPPKLPMWTVVIKALPAHLCVYPLGKSTLIFSCSTNGIISILTYISPVTYDSPRYIRSISLFPEQTHIVVQSFTVFNRFMLLHVHQKHDNGSLFFFTHDGILEHGPIQLSNPIHQYLADENRLWAIDSMTQTIFFHAQPLFTHEISSILSKRDSFISFDNESNFIPFRLALNHQLLAILCKDLQQVYIYNKISRERIFTSHFSAGTNMNIGGIALFPRDSSLLLKFDWSFDGTVKRSLFIHFNTKNQSVGRIEGKYCLGVVIGPNKEILIGFNLRTGVIRCYM